MDFTRYAYISIGANLPGDAGHPLETVKQAITRLAAFSDAPLLISPCFESDPKDCPPGSPQYCNAVTGLVPRKGTTASDLLAGLQALETEFGRHRSGLLNEARTLDLDIVTFPGESSNTPELMLPHPRAHERRFVLEPWIALTGAGYILQGRSLGQWLQACTDPPLQKL